MAASLRRTSGVFINKMLTNKAFSRPLSSLYKRSENIFDTNHHFNTKIKLLHTFMRPAHALTRCQAYVTQYAHEKSCWRCGANVDAYTNQRFCKCGVIQAPHQGLNYFQIMEMEETFDLDPQVLTKQFRQLQMRLHPDKFGNKSQQELNLAEEQSALVNKAYQVLHKPLSRALYFLELQEVTLEENEIDLDPEFLMEIMEINEQLSEAIDPDIVEKIGRENYVILENLLADISGAFKDSDYQKAKELLSKLKYHANIDDKVKEVERDGTMSFTHK